MRAERQSAQGHPMKSILEAQDGPPTSVFPGQPDRSFHGSGTGWPGKLDSHIEPSRGQNALVESPEEIPFRGCMHVQALHDGVLLQVVQQSLLEVRVVVPVVERARTSEEVDIFYTLLIADPASASC